MIREVRPLFEHQIEAMEFARQRTNFALFMEMRLGKTLTTIRIMQERFTHGPIFVCAPQTTLNGWMKELERENETYTAAYLSRGRDARFEAATSAYENSDKGRHWVLLHYPGLRICPGLAFLPDWRAAVLDESPVIKNPAAQISKLCAIGFRDTRCRVILSGSPTPESVLDIYQQMRFLMPSFMGYSTFWQWRAKYFTPDTWGKWAPKPDALRQIHDAVALFSYTKRRADTDLGGKRVLEERKVYMTPAQQKAYDTTEKRFITEFGNTTQWAIVMQNWLARMAGGFTPEKLPFHNHKFGELFDLLHGELSGERVVVWFKFNDELEMADRIADSFNVPHFTLFGDTKVKDRIEYEDGFRSGKYRWAFMQVLCGKYGMDMSSADTAIYYSNAYSCEAREQSIERTTHPTKKTPQLVIDLTTDRTVDEDVLEAANNKITNSVAFKISIKSRIEKRAGIHI